MVATSHSSLAVNLRLLEGKPYGIITAQIPTRPIQALSGPVAALADMLRSEHLEEFIECPGIYFLSQSPSRERPTQVYIGKSFNVRERLKQHANPKLERNKKLKMFKQGFWEQIYVITSNNSQQFRPYVDDLEKNLIQIALHKKRMVKLVNSARPEAISPDATHTSDIDEFVNQTRMILPFLGLHFVSREPEEEETPEGEISANKERFELKVKPDPENSESNAAKPAVACQVNQQFIVLKDSVARNRWVGEASTNTGYAHLRQDLVEKGAIVDGKDGFAYFTQNVPFNSPSAAASVVLGRQATGFGEWKLQGTKTTYGDWQTSLPE